MTDTATKIIHVDMDAYYASVEQRDNPSLCGKPLVVGGNPDSRGVVAAASYEAREYGVRSAMSCAKAHRLCPHAVFVRPNMKKYAEVAKQIRAIFHEVTDLVEPLSLDEAYLDVTENKLEEGSATKVAIYLKNRIREELNLIASAGVGPCKLVAKIASDFDKPDGLTVIAPEEVEAFLEPLSVRKVWGIGPVTAEKLESENIKTIGDIRACTVDRLYALVGNRAESLLQLSRGEDMRRVSASRERKSFGTEETFSKDVLDVESLKEVMIRQAGHIGERLAQRNQCIRTVTLKLRYADFTTITRSKTLLEPTRASKVLIETAKRLLLDKTKVGVRKVRLLGLSVSNFGEKKKDKPRQRVLPFIVEELEV